MTRVVGIDLGTTNSCVAVMDGDAPVVIANAEGSRTTPSVIGFAQSGERLVGQAARRQAMTNAENTVYAAKRLMGRKYEDDEVQRHLLTCPYEVVSADNGDAHIRIRGRDYSPPEISALVLAEDAADRRGLARRSGDRGGDHRPGVLRRRPAPGDQGRGRIAGLNILRIVNEPTAAALAYGVETEHAQRVAVYDLGGGTFDISILELRRGRVPRPVDGGRHVPGRRGLRQRGGRAPAHHVHAAERRHGPARRPDGAAAAQGGRRARQDRAVERALHRGQPAVHRGGA